MKSAERPRSFCAAHHVEDALGEVGRQRRRDLVEDQQLRVARERPREVEHPQQRQRQVERLLGEVDVEVEVVQVPPDRVDRRAGEAEVLLDRQVGDERRILEDGREPDPRRLRGRGDARLLCRSRGSCPPSGRITPVSTLTSVLLPAPFAPSSACTSPGSTTSVADRSATTGP